MPKTDYPYLRAWCKMMGSLAYYTEMQVEEAHKEEAPFTAIYKGSDGTWHTFEEIKQPKTKSSIEQLVKDQP